LNDDKRRRKGSSDYEEEYLSPKEDYSVRVSTRRTRNGNGYLNEQISNHESKRVTRSKNSI
jgi:hypothetical protein